MGRIFVARPLRAAFFEDHHIGRQKRQRGDRVAGLECGVEGIDGGGRVRRFRSDRAWVGVAVGVAVYAFLS